MSKKNRQDKMHEEESPTQTVTTEEDARIAALVANASDFDEAEWDRQIMAMEDSGNVYDFAQAQYEFHLPKECARRQENKENKYCWRLQANAERLCNGGLFPHFFVNRTNHPEIPDSMFNKNNAIYRGGQYLLYMPWKVYAKRCEFMDRKSNAHMESLEDRKKRILTREGSDEPVVQHYDPSPRGADGSGDTNDMIDGMNDLVVDEHPDDKYIEQGEAVSGVE